jgi:hypothetical protein
MHSEIYNTRSPHCYTSSTLHFIWTTSYHCASLEHSAYHDHDDIYAAKLKLSQAFPCKRCRPHAAAGTWQLKATLMHISLMHRVALSLLIKLWLRVGMRQALLLRPPVSAISPCSSTRVEQCDVRQAQLLEPLSVTLSLTGPHCLAAHAACPLALLELGVPTPVPTLLSERGFNPPLNRCVCVTTLRGSPGQPLQEIYGTEAFEAFLAIALHLPWLHCAPLLLSFRLFLRLRTSHVYMYRVNGCRPRTSSLNLHAVYIPLPFKYWKVAIRFRRPTLCIYIYHIYIYIWYTYIHIHIQCHMYG